MDDTSKDLEQNADFISTEEQIIVGGIFEESKLRIKTNMAH